VNSNASSAVLAVPDDSRLSAGLLFLLAMASGVIVANLYYAQPLVGPISASIGLAPGASGLIVTLTQVGYALGLLLIVPLADLIENRRLVVTALLVTLGALLAAALATDRWLFLPAAFVIGLSCVAAQVLVPYAAHFTAEAHRGRAVGTVMTGLLLGIMLSRPTASVIAGVWSWHAVYFASAVALALLIAVLARKLPQRRPSASMSYLALLGSMGNLLLTTPILRRRALYHALMFGAFSVFWTTAPLLLAGPAFRVSQTGIALFALVGVAGAIAAPIAGQLADRGWARPATAVAMLLVLGGFALSRTATHGTHAELLLLGACGILIDLGVAANLVLGQRAIFVLGAEYRSRLNGLYMATFFLGGALGSSLGAWSYFTHGGWSAAVLLGAAAPTLGLVYFGTELGWKPAR
jgi:predicted MFS family arabinose efflux permease